MNGNQSRTQASKQPQKKLRAFFARKEKRVAYRIIDGGFWLLLKAKVVGEERRVNGGRRLLSTIQILMH